jgi:hypothetical protein
MEYCRLPQERYLTYSDAKGGFDNFSDAHSSVAPNAEPSIGVSLLRRSKNKNGYDKLPNNSDDHNRDARFSDVHTTTVHSPIITFSDDDMSSLESGLHNDTNNSAGNESPATIAALKDWPARGEVEFRNISLRYGDDGPVVLK